MIYKTITGAAAALAIGTLAGLTLASAPAQAELPLPPGGWVALPGTTVVEVDGEHVLRMDQSATAAGTSLENSIGGSIHADLAVSFTFKLESGSCGGGAPRVFLAGAALYGQVLDCPAAEAGEWQTVDLTADGSWWAAGVNVDWATVSQVGQLGGTPLGSVGLVWDNAAGTDAVALFKDITIGAALDLGEPEPEPDPSPTDDPSPEPTTSPSTDPATGTGGSADDKLPTTGANLPLYVGGGAGLAGLGGGLLLLLRRRRPTFTAE